MSFPTGTTGLRMRRWTLHDRPIASAFLRLWIGELRTFDAVAALGAIGQLTNTIDLALGPLPVGTRDPVSLALAAGTISVNSGRRVTLAIGSSTPTVVRELARERLEPQRRTSAGMPLPIVRQVFEAKPTQYLGRDCHKRWVPMELGTTADRRGDRRVWAKHACLCSRAW